MAPFGKGITHYFTPSVRGRVVHKTYTSLRPARQEHQRMTKEKRNEVQYSFLMGDATETSDLRRG
jgi:hypothetical protein